MQKRTHEQERMLQLLTSYTAEESTLLSRPGSEDAAPSAGIAAHARAGQDAAHEGAHTADDCLAMGITPYLPHRCSPRGTKGKEVWARLLMKKRCGERVDSGTKITAEEKRHGRSLSATVNGISPSAQARGRRPRQQPDDSKLPI
jgi:hypothetical protein